MITVAALGCVVLGGSDVLPRLQSCESSGAESGDLDQFLTGAADRGPCGQASNPPTAVVDGHRVAQGVVLGSFTRRLERLTETGCKCLDELCAVEGSVTRTRLLKRRCGARPTSASLGLSRKDLASELS